MGLYELGGRVPSVGEGTYVSPAAHVIGDVRIGEGCWIGPGAVIRGDFGPITIGGFSAVEENCVVHCYPDSECVVGEYVTIGHNATVHAARVGDYVTVGMGAVLGVDAVVGSWCIVGEGAVVRSRQEIPPDTVVAGVPAERIGSMDDAKKKYRMEGKRLYAGLGRRYKEGLKPL
ncbi:MAG: gamma carbonic anhydrase family protein [Deltaproteobacteria bacterium]|nr:gamma carbonic anhydrase family protein [Deltaproteobacteria bacterium]